MRTLVGALMMLPLAALAGCCCSGGAPGSSTTPPAQAGRTAPAKSCVMQSAGRAVLRLAIPPDGACTQKDGSLRLESPARDVFDVWLVKDARTVDAAVARVPAQITSEFKDFKTTSSTPLTIAGAPALRLAGSGVEADDNDPGTADIIVFKAGASVFIACAHGESLSPGAQRWMLAVVQTAQAP